MRRRFFFDARLNLARHRIRDLFSDMRNEPDGARHDPDTPYDLPRQPEL